MYVPSLAGGVVRCSGVGRAVRTWWSRFTVHVSHCDRVKGVHADVHHPFTDPARWTAYSAGHSTSHCATDLLEEGWSLHVKRNGQGGGGPSLRVRLQCFVAGVFAGRSRTNLVKVAIPTVPPQDTALLALTSSALVIIVLVLLALSIIYCKRFWKSQCQRGESMPAVLLFLLPLLFTRARGPLLTVVSIVPSVAALAAYSHPNVPLLIQKKHLILLFASAGPLLCFACSKTRRSLPPP